MQIEKPTIYEIHGKRYFEVDELIDFNLDKYNVLKKHHAKSVDKLYDFCQKVKNDEYIPEKEKEKGIKTLVDVLVYEKLMKELRTEFSQLAKAKREGKNYFMITG